MRISKSVLVKYIYIYKKVVSAELVPISKNVYNSGTSSSETAVVRIYLKNCLCLIYDLFLRVVHGIFGGQIFYEK